MTSVEHPKEYKVVGLKDLNLSPEDIQELENFCAIIAGEKMNPAYMPSYMMEKIGMWNKAEDGYWCLYPVSKGKVRLHVKLEGGQYVFTFSQEG